MHTSGQYSFKIKSPKSANPEVLTSLFLFIGIGSARVCLCVSCSVVSDSATPWTVANQAVHRGKQSFPK